MVGVGQRTGNRGATRWAGAGLCLALTTALGAASAGFNTTDLAVPKEGKVGFTLLPASATGIHFTNYLAENRHLTNQILLNGAGVAAGDVDGDGWCDLYFCCLDQANALYRNLGNWRFADVTAAAGVACSGIDSTSAVFADLDGDRDLDLLVGSVFHGVRVFFNDGQGRFGESQPALCPGKGTMSIALGDLDGDGDLDLYVANYRAVTLRDQPNTRFTFRVVDGKPVVTAVDGRPITEPDLANRFNFKIVLQEGGGTFAHEENGEPDALYRNDGSGRFTPVPFTDGTFLDEEGRPLQQPFFDWGLSVMIRDLNEDGAPDIYVCNDFQSPDRVWMNDGRGRFRLLDRLALRQASLSAMSLDVADLNRDGHDDIFVSEMLSPDHERRHTQRTNIRPELLPAGLIDNRPQYPRNTLQLNRGDGTYAEIAQFSGLDASDWSWSVLFLDVDLDGYEDLLVPNGFERDNMNVDALRQLEERKRAEKLPAQEQLRLRTLFPRLETPNLAFRNLGHLKFQDQSDAWNFNFRGISQGMILADLDNDGDQDVVINNLGQSPCLCRNDTTAARVAVRLKGLAPNTKGIGARLILTGGPVNQSQQIMAGGRYLSSDQPQRAFAAGPGQLQLEILWRSGRRSLLRGVQSNRLYEIDEAAAEPPAPVPPRPSRPPIFEDVSALLGHTHHEEDFDDFARQPLLSRQLSRLGPGLCWWDIDQDGRDDLLIGSGRGGTLAAYHNDGPRGFSLLQTLPWTQIVTRDQTGLVAGQASDGALLLFAGSANYEDGLSAGSVARQYDVAAQRLLDTLPGHDASAGPLALADVDGDGDLDLFVGSRVVPGRYPYAGASLLFLQEPGGFVLDSANTNQLAKVGMVSGAVFSDLDGDGDPDLVLACDWGPLRILRNDRGALRDVTAQWGLDTYTGWWNGVAAGDFNGDGRMDLVAANWGQNTKYERFRHQPLRLYYGDFDGNGSVETIEGYFHPAKQQWLPLQPFHVTALAMPWLQLQVGNCARYGKATLQNLYPGQLSAFLEAACLETTLFLNQGARFQARPLPPEAQLSPAFAVCVADLDGDGHEDVFLSQNFFATDLETSRYDAGRGLWLRGNGQGEFQAVPGQESGLIIWGEQRGAALADYDADGRIDLAVAQNAAPTKLFHNRGARPGLRVRLRGPPANPQAIGALLRLQSPAGQGPAREIHAGSGYWSQDSSVQVLAAPQPPASLFIRWPGGQELTVPIPPNARELLVDSADRVQPQFQPGSAPD